MAVLRLWHRTTTDQVPDVLRHGPTNALPSIFLHFPLTSSDELQFRFFATADLTLARMAQNWGTIDTRRR